MRTTAPGTGAPADVLNGLIIQLRSCADLRAVVARWPRLCRTLEDVARRVSATRARGGSTPAVVSPLKWLDAVLRDHPALDEPGGEPLRSELRSLVARIRERA
jgi:hypothetical protein